jgi:hypothetical protein
MDLPIHVGMDSRVKGGRPTLCCRGGIKQYSFIHSFCTYAFSAYFYFKQHTDAEKYIFKVLSLPLMKFQCSRENKTYAEIILMTSTQ